MGIAPIDHDENEPLRPIEPFALEIVGWMALSCLGIGAFLYWLG